MAALAGALVAIGIGHVGVLDLGGDSHDGGELPEVVQQLPNTGLDADGVRVLLTSPTSGSVVLVGVPSDATPAADAAAHLANFAVDLGGTLPSWAAAPVPPLRRLPALVRHLSLPRIARWVSGRAIGLALSSGGSKTVAHVGVVRVLRELGVEIDAVAGASGGSVVAAAVARGISDTELERWVEQLAPAFKWTKLGPKLPPREALFRGTGPHGLFRTWHGDTQIADCDLPLFVVAADLATGAEVCSTAARSPTRSRASMSIPGVAGAAAWNGRYLIDGGIVSPLPARILRDAGIGWVIGSDVAGQEPDGDGTRIVRRVCSRRWRRMVSTMERSLFSSQIALLDVHIRPVVHAANSFDFSNPDPILAEGVRAAREQLPRSSAWSRWPPGPERAMLARPGGEGVVDSFEGKIAVVTGGGTGMGRELVRQLAADGCHVATCDVAGPTPTTRATSRSRVRPRGRS